MNVGEIVYKILGDDANFKKVMGNVGKLATQTMSAIAEAALAASAAAATAVGALAKEAIASFGDYEQLAGGAKLMFGEAYDFIAEKAKIAYKDIQMSQNDYLEQVNGFAIGLKTAMGGDELGAAKLADRIVTAEADIVAATGNTAENVQNAFNGIMKNNYTMLDNLQIGITPTKEGFQELIDKVNAYKEAQGDATRYTIDNLADCQNALVDYIEMQGLAGYAQAEGADTLQGSMASMTAAWQNMLTGMADPTQDFDELISALIDSVLNFSNNLMPRIMAVLPQMATGITELTENLLPLIPDTLEQMLPSVIEGANSLIAALLDTLSSIADTAIPIVTENADEIINTLLSGLISAIPSLASSAADLCTALITAILDNADIITQGAVDIVLALADGIVNNLPELIPAAVEATTKIIDGLLSRTGDLLNAALEIIKAIADGLVRSIPVLLEAVPTMLIDLSASIEGESKDLLEHPAKTIALDICEGIADGIMSFDWSETVNTMLRNIADAEAAADGYEVLGSQEEAEARLSEALDELEEKNGRLSGSFLELKKNLLGYEEELGTAGNFGSDAAKRAEEDAKKHFASFTETAQEEAESLILTGDELKEAVTAIDNAYALGNYDSEKQYWADRLALLEANRNEEDQQWIKYYSQTKQHYDKAVETERNAAEAAETKAKKDAETALKNSVEDKFRELETEQLQKNYDDSWLLEQERAFIETLDHNSYTYQDYNLKLLKEQKSYDDKALKEVETAAKKQRDTLEKVYDSVVKSRDSLASSLKGSSGDIFNSSEETDKRTGAKTKSNKIDLSGFEKKLAAKKKLTSKIAELYEKNVPDSLINELLKQDPEAALDYATQLLKDPKKLSKIRSLYKDDEGVSNIIANMVTENSEEFEKLGTDAGTLFGDSFMEAFRQNWEQSMKDVFDGNYFDAAAANVSAANSSAALSANTSAANTTAADSQDTSAAVKRTSASSGSPVYKVVDLDGKYVAKVVAQENKRAKTASGG